MIETQDLDRIKAAVSDAVAEAMEREPALASYTRTLALNVLDAIDGAAADPTDPRPFGVGKAVASREWAGLKGKVVRRVETNGELHTVDVQWSNWPSVEHYSPSELVEL